MECLVCSRPSDCNPERGKELEEQTGQAAAFYKQAEEELTVPPDHRCLSAPSECGSSAPPAAYNMVRIDSLLLQSAPPSSREFEWEWVMKICCDKICARRCFLLISDLLLTSQTPWLLCVLRERLQLGVSRWAQWGRVRMTGRLSSMAEGPQLTTGLKTVWPPSDGNLTEDAHK